MNAEVERPPQKQFLNKPLTGKIEFRDVVFSYTEGGANTLNGVSFKIAPGEHVGLIGKAGSGKTSIQKLLLKLYQPHSGQILVDDLDINQFDPAEYRRKIAYIPQEIILFNGTIRENITLSFPDATDSKILEAAEISGVDKIAQQDPEGFNRQVGERGSLLSGGQRQALAIARAMLGESYLYLFDEPNSALDNVSVQHFMNRLEKKLIGKTLLLVSHQANMLRMLDRLIVLDQGKIIADGPRDKVLPFLQRKAQESNESK